MAKSNPLVSVVMAVHNGERHLDAALSSILAQTYGNFEVIVINDGSVDSTAERLARYDDSRLRVLINPTRQGLAVSLNRGLDVAEGDYVARMDADDLCHPQRIERQVEFMEGHPEIGLLGTACHLIDERGQCVGSSRHPAGDAAIRWRLLFAPAVAHPTAMIRTALLRRHGLRYNSIWPVAQDYELWPRLLQHCRGANLSEKLLGYRVHLQSASAARRKEQDQWALRVCEREAVRFLPPDMPITLLAPLRRTLLGAARAEDPPASYLRGQLLYLTQSYIRKSHLDREKRNEVWREAVATVLMDGSVVRPFGPSSVALLGRSFLIAPGTAMKASGRLAWHFLAHRICAGVTQR